MQQGQYFGLAYNDTVFAKLSKVLSTLIFSLLSQHEFRILAYVPRETCVWEGDPWDVRIGSTLPVELNVYGRREDAGSIGRTLSKAGTYLQFPRCGIEGVEYYNPHFFRMEGYPDQASIETLILSPPEVVEARDWTYDQGHQPDDAEAINEILDSLSYHNLRDDIRVDSRIKTALFPYVILYSFASDMMLRYIATKRKQLTSCSSERLAGFLLN